MGGGGGGGGEVGEGVNRCTQKSITRSLHLVLGRVLCLSRVGYF